VFSSCAINKYGKAQAENPLPYWELNSGIYHKHVEKYKTTIDVLKNHLSGILLVKQTSDDTTCITFVSELGMKYFDFIITEDSVNARYVFEPLNKPLVINALKNNFKNIFLLNFKIEAKANKKSYVLQKIKDTKHRSISIYEGDIKQEIYETKQCPTFAYDFNKQKTYFITGYDSRRQDHFVLQQETFHGKKLNTRIKYKYRQKYELYETISCIQYGLIKFRFNLERIYESLERQY
jgi:hypothetical protein